MKEGQDELRHRVRVDFFIGNKLWAGSNLTSPPPRSCDLAHAPILELAMKC